jgi:hypothetical protein
MSTRAKKRGGLDLTDIEAKFLQDKMKKNTISSYLKSFKRILVNVFESKRPDLDTLTDPASITRILDFVKRDDVALSSKPLILISYKKALSALGYDTQIQSLEKAINSYLQQNKNDKQHKQFTPEEKLQETDRRVTMEELNEWRLEYKALMKPKILTKDDVFYFILSLYTLLPPDRYQVYYDTLIFEDSDKETNLADKNYFCLKKKRLVLNDYKTAKKYGDTTTEITGELYDIIKDFHDKSRSPYFICTHLRTKFSGDNFYRHLIEATRGKVSCNRIRNQFISEKIDSKAPIDEMKQLARAMKHDYSTQQLIYSKLSNSVNHFESDHDLVLQLKQQLQERDETIKQLQSELNALKNQSRRD